MMMDPGRRRGTMLGTGAVVIGLFVLFIVAVAWFRRPQSTEVNKIGSIAGVLRPDPISQAVLNGAIDTEAKTATIALVEGGRTVGEAQRGEKDGKPFYEFKIALPDIDREAWFYEVWLVRPLPYGFFSLGEMVSSEEADFVLEWEGEEGKEYAAYVDVVVTRQEYGGSRDPQMHVAKGTFGK
ncbi:hypothetical protein FJZ23_00480 [Candidatus Parcubacteria bacterium]|nr:hypothetical protein [Candidatus Parcubacteria bacterium]